MCLCLFRFTQMLKMGFKQWSNVDKIRIHNEQGCGVMEENMVETYA